MATDVWLLGGSLVVVSAVLARAGVTDLRRKRRAARAIDAWACAPIEQLLAEARRRAASFAPSRAGQRLARQAIATDAELLECLRTLRFQVCSSFAGLKLYDDSGLHAILLALKQRQVQLSGAPGPHLGVFR
jgi:hypothetical protein